VKGGHKSTFKRFWYEKNSEDQMEEKQETLEKKKAFLHYD
jgi:hypothetical protein